MCTQIRPVTLPNRHDPHPRVFCHNKRVGTVVSNLSKVPENRKTLLKELVSVAKSLGAVSTHDLQSLGRQLDVAKRDAVARVSGSFLFLIGWAGCCHTGGTGGSFA